MSSELSPRFQCAQCKIAFFFSPEHLQKHREECSSLAKLEATLQEFRVEMSDQHRLLQVLTDTLQAVHSQVQELAAKTTRKRGRPRIDDSSSLASTTLASATLAPEKQLALAIAHFRKRKLTLPLSIQSVAEVEQLLNDLFAAPKLSLENFRDLVKENATVIRSLLHEFKDMLQSAKQKVRREDEEDEEDEEEEEEEEEDEWFDAHGLSAGEVTASLEASGGAQKLLLSKFLHIFREGFETHRVQFPMVIFDVGQRRRILKLNERLFYSTVPEEEQEQEEDRENIVCFPFFVYVNAAVGWKVLRFTDHIYPLFAIINSTILKRGVEHSESIIHREERRVNSAFSLIQSMETDRSLMLTRKLEAEYFERHQMATKLSESVLMFMMQFRKKFFDDFLQTLYEEFSFSAEDHYRQRATEEEEEAELLSGRNSSRFTSRSSTKSARFTRSVYVLGDEEIYSEEEDSCTEM